MKSYSQIFKIFLSPKMMLITILGFSSGLPLALTGSTLQAWLTKSGVDITTIGIFSLVGLPYTVKFLWSPFLDIIPAPFWGRRRGWATIILLCLIASEAYLAFLNPQASIVLVACGAFLVAFFSASQDIVVDAFRTEVLEKDEYGAGAGVFNMGYRLAMLVSGAVALTLADHMSWQKVYFIMATVQILGILAIYISKEPVHIEKSHAKFRERVIEPFIDLFRRHGAWEILAFVMLYKLGTMMGTALTTTFLLSKDFSLTEIGAVTKVVGLIATIVGTLSGGALMARFGLKRALWTFGILQSFGILTFIILAVLGHNYIAMVGVIAAENFMIGLGVAAIQGFIMNVCSLQYTATHFALLSSLTAVTRVIFSAQAGRLVAVMGWVNYFIFSAALAIPGLLLLTQFSKWSMSDSTNLRELKRADLIFLVTFIFGLLVMCTEVIWRLVGLNSMAPYAAVGGAILASVSLLSGIVYSRVTHAVE